MVKGNKIFIQYLKDLKSLGAKAFKLELESEYIQEPLCREISNIIKENSLLFALKLGGFSSYNDILISKNIDADIIIAPMVETDYALKKFIETLRCTYSSFEISNKKIFINIETKSGIENFDKILNSKYFETLDGIVIGRGDLTSSFEIPHSLVNSNDVKKIIIPVIEKCLNNNKKVILGGNITAKSVEFLKDFSSIISGFETRKIFFDFDTVNKENLDNIINKAIEFEIFYLEMLFEIQNQRNIKDRINTLKDRLQ